MKHTGHALLAALLALPLLLGCPMPTPRGSQRPPNPADLRIIDLVIAESAARGFDVSGRCADERRSRIAVVDADDETMRRHIGYCASGSDTCLATAGLEPEARAMARARAGCLLGICSAGSIAHAQDDVWPANLGRWRLDIYVSAYLDAATRRDVIAHEAAHGVSACSGHGEDQRHADARLWGPGGVVETVQRQIAAEGAQ